MDINALRDMVNRVNPSRGTDNPHRNVYFKPSYEPTVVRVLPNPHLDTDIPFFEKYFHYGVAGERSITCPKQEDGSPCPICYLADDFRSRSGGGKDDPNFKIFLDLQARPRVYAPVLVRGQEDEGVKLWGFPQSIFQYFVEKAADSDWGDFTHPINGRDVTVQLLKKGTEQNRGMYDRPSASLKPGQSPVFKDKDEIKSLLATIPNYFELDPPLFPIKDYDELVEIVKKIGQEDSDNEVEISSDLTETSTTDSTTSETSDELSSKLDDLLAD